MSHLQQAKNVNFMETQWYTDEMLSTNHCSCSSHWTECVNVT